MEPAAPPAGGAAMPPETPRQDEDPEGCVVCMAAPAEVFLHPCGHCELCASCTALVVAKEALCPTCRGAIQSVSHQPVPARCAGAR